ncbi:hypothetical protein D3C81_1099890 [compost metagenome]
MHTQSRIVIIILAMAITANQLCRVDTFFITQAGIPGLTVQLAGIYQWAGRGGIISIVSRTVVITITTHKAANGLIELMVNSAVQRFTHVAIAILLALHTGTAVSHYIIAFGIGIVAGERRHRAVAQLLLSGSVIGLIAV